MATTRPSFFACFTQAGFSPSNRMSVLSKLFEGMSTIHGLSFSMSRSDPKTGLSRSIHRPVTTLISAITAEWTGIIPDRSANPQAISWNIPGALSLMFEQFE
jgi:hypothetical protein